MSILDLSKSPLLVCEDLARTLSNQMVLEEGRWNVLKKMIESIRNNESISLEVKESLIVGFADIAGLECINRSDFQGLKSTRE